MRSPMPGRWLPLAIAAAVALATPGAAVAEPPSLAKIEEEVMCIVCGVPLSMSREAPAAKRQRAYISQLIAEGLDSDQIKDRLIVEYGKGVLIEPEGEGFDLAAWLVPIAAFLAAVGLLGWTLARWRREDPPAGSDPDVPAELSPEDADLVDSALRERD